MKHILLLTLLMISTIPRFAAAHDPAGWAEIGGWIFLIAPALLMNLLTVPLTATRRKSRWGRMAVIGVVVLCFLVNLLCLVGLFLSLFFADQTPAFLLGQLVNLFGLVWVSANVIQWKKQKETQLTGQLGAR